MITPTEVAYAENRLLIARERNVEAKAVADRDGEAGMAWRNAVETSEREKWMKAGGETGVVADASAR